MPLKLFVFMLCLSVNLFSQDIDSLALPEKAQLGFTDKHTDWVMDVPQAALPPLHYFKDHKAPSLWGHVAQDPIQGLRLSSFGSINAWDVMRPSVHGVPVEDATLRHVGILTDLHEPMRYGPLPVTEWYGASAHQNGQVFGVMVSASANPRNHWLVNYKRTQAEGSLLTEGYFMDNLTIKQHGWTKDEQWAWNVDYQSSHGRVNETGGVLETDVLTVDSLLQSNRSLVTTRWTNASSEHKLSRWDMRLAHDQFFVRSNGYVGQRQFSRPVNLWTDSLVSLNWQWEVGMRLKKSWHIGFGMDYKTQAYQGEDSLHGPAWDPFIHLNSSSEFADVAAHFNLVSSAYQLKLTRDHKAFPFEMAIRRREPFAWEGMHVDAINSQSLIVPLWNDRITMNYQASSEEPILRVDDWQGMGQWETRDAWSSFALEWHHGSSKVNDAWQSDYRARYQYGSTAELCLPTWSGEAEMVRQWDVKGLTPGLKAFIGFSGRAWSGGWQRPVYIPERGQFAILRQANLMPASGVIHGMIGLELPQLSLKLHVQNANQGWLPNGIFMAEHYPLPPATVRVTARWRMFN